MMKPKTKFLVGGGIIVAVLVWLGLAGVRESKTYYVTIAELQARDSAAFSKRLRVAGDVVNGSIRRDGRKVSFQLKQAEHLLPVVYVGSEPLPDTFVGGAQAIAEGRYQPDHVFVAKHIQAKCASKYEAAPPGAAQKAASVAE